MQIIKQTQQEKFQLNKQNDFSPNLQQKSSFFSWLLFLWTNSLISKGSQNPLEAKDLSDLSQKQQPSQSHKTFSKLYNSKAKNANNKIIAAAKDFIGYQFIVAGILSAIGQSMLLIGPVMIKRILLFIDSNETGESLISGFIYVTILLFSYMIRSILMQHANHKVNFNAVQITNALTSLIYQKLLNISSSSRKYLSSGAILNYINVDCSSIHSFIILSPYLFTGPLMIITAIILLMIQVGIIGLLIPILFIFGMYWQQKLLKKGFQKRKNQLKLLDKRSRSINQYFSGIRVIKYYGWETFIEKSIENIRKEQIILNFSFLMIRTYIEMLMKMLPIIASIVVFGLYSNIYQVQQLTLAKAMTILSIFNLITNPMRLMVSVFLSYMNVTVSLNRIQNFCQFQEKQVKTLNNEKNVKVGEIQFLDCQFYWESDNTRIQTQNANIKKTSFQSKDKQSDSQNVRDSLQFVNLKKQLLNIQDQIQQVQLITLKKQQSALKIKYLKIQSGEFVAVVGRVASGKSTFLYSILGEIYKKKGNIFINGNIAYIPQISWLKSSTIKQNIIFQSQYNEQRYLQVLKLCQLEDDLKILPGGDLTQIGQKGLNLSGGQKQRISIARAVYADSNIYLIDDCLSALDSYVSKNIFNHVFKKYLREKNKTVIMVTNSLNFTDFCDRVLVLKKGQIIQDGIPQILNKDQTSFYYNLKLRHKKLMEEEQQQKRKYRQSIQKRRQASIDLSQFSYESQQVIEQSKKKKKFQRLIKAQERIKGSVPWDIYLRFFSETKIITSVFLLTFICLCQTARVSSDWWLAYWTQRFNTQKKNQYLLIYTGICFLVCLLMFLRGLFFAKFIIRTSKTIHKKLIETLLKTPLSWFDVTPTGRILARTIKDQDDLDNMLPYNLQNSSQNILIVLSSIILISVAHPWYILLAIISLSIYSSLIKKFLASSRQIKRLESNFRAPLLSHIQETVNGMLVLRAFSKQKQFTNKFFNKQKAFIICLMNQNIAQRWINLVTDTFSILTIACAAYLAIFKLQDKQNKNNTTMIGLALVWTIQMSSIMPYTIKTLTDTENNMNSLVRMYDYIDNNPFQKDFLKPKPLHPQWPSQGEFFIQKISYKYRPQLPYVIKNISFEIEPKSKIGIVGRTGCGKSTITLGLLRILQIYPNQDQTIGAIYLDQQNISNIGLHYLRHRISIIPQDPILFTGTIRSNIDPLGNYTDNQIQISLKKVKLWNEIPNQLSYSNQTQQKLNSKVEQAGTNYSLGQKQLICLARALIRKPKILIMDQATASIDQKTDEAIQNMIREQFKQSTVITIAHRLNTLIYYDKILVLDKGEIMEFDTPLNLVKNQNSFLGKLIRKIGYTYMKGIIDLAQKSAETKLIQKTYHLIN